MPPQASAQAKIPLSHCCLEPPMSAGKREGVENRLWHFVDVRDVAKALILVYEKPEASGRYVCAPHPMEVKDLVEMLKGMYPNYDFPKR
jgi:nucleoside-diphosphate-sugar epimerase